jgi:hypothetical protein
MKRFWICEIYACCVEGCPDAPLEWATDYRDELMEDWNLCSQLKSPKPIDPLT